MRWYIAVTALCIFVVCVEAAPFSFIAEEGPGVYYDPIPEDGYLFIVQPRIRRSPQLLQGRRNFYEPPRIPRRQPEPVRYGSGPGPSVYDVRRPAANRPGAVNFPSSSGGSRPGVQPVGQSSSQSSAQSFSNGGQGGSAANTQSQSLGGGQAYSSGGAQSFNFGPGGASGSAANSQSSAGGFGAPASASAGAQSINQNPSFGTFPSFGGGGFSGSSANSATSVGRK